MPETNQIPNSDLPTFRTGQTCDGCSACCMHLGVPPIDSGLIGIPEWSDDSEPEWMLMPLWLRITILAAWDAGRNSGPCVFLDQRKRRCRRYGDRPSICRLFEPGCDICIEDRELLGIEYLRPLAANQHG